MWIASGCCGRPSAPGAGTTASCPASRATRSCAGGKSASAPIASWSSKGSALWPLRWLCDGSRTRNWPARLRKAPPISRTIGRPSSTEAPRPFWRKRNSTRSTWGPCSNRVPWPEMFCSVRRPFLSPLGDWDDDGGPRAHYRRATCLTSS